MSWNKEPTEVRFKRIVHQTPDAVLFEHEKKVRGKTVLLKDWIPKSQIEDVEDLECYEKDEDGTIVIPQWLADERDWD
jgi:hypothetical protein